MLTNLKKINQELSESVSGKRIANAGMLLKQFKDIGVTIKAKDADDIQHKLAKLLDLVPTSSLTMVYSGLLAPVLIQLVKFDHFPIKSSALTTFMNRSSDFEKKTEDFPTDIYEKMVKYGFLKTTSISHETAYKSGSVHVQDLLNYLVQIGLRTGHLEIPTNE